MKKKLKLDKLNVVEVTWWIAKLRTQLWKDEYLSYWNYTECFI